jgi:hypothetical protein
MKYKVENKKWDRRFSFGEREKEKSINILVGIIKSE